MFKCGLTEVGGFLGVVAPSDDPDDRSSRHPGAVHHYGHVGVVVRGVGDVVTELRHGPHFPSENSCVIPKKRRDEREETPLSARTRRSFCTLNAAATFFPFYSAAVEGISFLTTQSNQLAQIERTCKCCRLEIISSDLRTSRNSCENCVQFEVVSKLRKK